MNHSLIQRRGTRIAVASIAFSCIASSMPAQNFNDRALSVVGGAFQYHLSGTGTTGFIGVRLDLPMHAHVILEPGATYASYLPATATQVGAQKITLLMPEAQLQVQTTSPRVRPFAGLGVGASLASGGAPSESDLMLSAALGARIRLNDKWRLRTELRLRTIDPFYGSAAEWTGGVSVRF